MCKQNRHVAISKYNENVLQEITKTQAEDVNSALKPRKWKNTETNIRKRYLRPLPSSPISKSELLEEIQHWQDDTHMRTDNDEPCLDKTHSMLLSKSQKKKKQENTKGRGIDQDEYEKKISHLKEMFENSLLTIIIFYNLYLKPEGKLTLQTKTISSKMIQVD